MENLNEYAKIYINNYPDLVNHIFETINFKQLEGKYTEDEILEYVINIIASEI